MALPYPPPFQDLRTLSEHISAGESTIENWVKLGLFPAPKKVGGKRLWQWKEVERHLAGGGENGSPSADEQADKIRAATKVAAAHQ
jgi:predicted DNA-binding transcriptional regulator AlpA